MATLPPPQPDKKPSRPPSGASLGGVVFGRVFDTEPNVQARRSGWRALAYACPEFSEAVHSSAPMQVEQIVEAFDKLSGFTRTRHQYVAFAVVSNGWPPEPAHVVCRFTAGVDLVVTAITTSHWMFTNRTYVLFSVARGNSDKLEPIGRYVLAADHDELPRRWA